MVAKARRPRFAKTKLYVLAEMFREHPELLNMGTWFVEYKRADGECGTTGCIAGWTCHKFPPKDMEEMPRAGQIEKSDFFFENARTSLRLSRKQADRLFYAQQWPGSFYQEFLNASRELPASEIPNYFSMTAQEIRDYRMASERRRRANVTAKRILHFIATGGRE